MESLVSDAAAAQRELAHAFERLLQGADRRRLDGLLEKDRASSLSAEEKLELQRLTMELARPRLNRTMH